MASIHSSRCFCRKSAGDVLRARGVLTRFRLLHSKSGTTFSYNLLIKGYARSENPLEALPLLQEISNQGLRPDRLTYNTVILACAKARKMDIAMDILNKMKNEAGKLNSIELLPNVITYTTLLKGFEHDRNLDGVMRIVDEMRAERSCVLDRVAYSAIIDAFLACGSVSEAVKVFEELLELSKSDANFRPKTHVYLSLMRSFAKMGDVKMVQNLHARMVPECSGNPSPSLRAEADWLLIESAVCDNQLDLAKQILDNVLQKRIKLILSDRAYMTIVRLHAFSGFTDQRFQPKVFNKYSADDPVEKMMIPYLEAKPVPARLQLAKVVMRFYEDDAVPVEDQWGQCIGIVYREDCKELTTQLSAMMRSPPPYITSRTSVKTAISIILDNKYKMVAIVKPLSGIGNRNSYLEGQTIGFLTPQHLFSLCTKSDNHNE